MKKNPTPKSLPATFLSFLPIIGLVIILFLIIRSFGNDALSGGVQISLLAGTAICSTLAMAFCNVKWIKIEEAICNNIKGVGTALIILLLIGALSGSWMVSGIVPTLIYYGINLLHPSFFLVSCCIICAIVSVTTGSSWTTIATIGIALMGIGQALNFPAGMVGGAIISGAYFGDKISPLSDTTVLASSVTNTPLFKHIKYMMLTTTPSITITLLIFTVLGFMHKTSGSSDIQTFATALDSKFNISLWTLIVPVLTGVMIAKKVPSLITLFMAALMGGICAIIAQPELLQEIAGGTDKIVDTFKGTIITMYGSTQIDTGNLTLNELVQTRGMAGMLNTIWLILCAMCFGGAMTASGMLESITLSFIRFMKKRTSMVSSTVFSGLLLNLCTGDQYISIILTGNMFKSFYKEKGYESRLLSRTTEDAVTVTSVLIPWNTCGMTQSTILGVATLTYLPYCFFNLISPLMSIFIAFIGYKIYNTHEKN